MLEKHLIRVKPLSRSRGNYFKKIIFLIFVFLFALFLQQEEIHRKCIFQCPKDLSVWIFDVGQGDAIFLQTPEGKQILIDAGGSHQILSKLGSVLLPWDRKIDAFISTHPDADHLTGGIDLLDRYQVKTIYETGVQSNEPIQEGFYEAIEEKHIPIQFLKGGDSFFIDGVHFNVLAPDLSVYGKKIKETNEASLVLLVTYRQTNLLFTADLPTQVETQIFDDLHDPVDVLKVAHHGSAYATSSVFLDHIHPRFSIISVGSNTYGHPHPVVLKRLKDHESQIFRTDQDGDILIQSNGKELMVQSTPLLF